MTPERIEQLLIARGMHSSDERERFLNPDYERDIHDPFLFKNMERATERIHEAVEKGERIVIYTDYDTDGIPGGVVLSDYFKKIGYDNVRVYIPHRVLEGFGLNLDAVEEIAQEGAALVITIDCGSTDVREAEQLKARGVDLIITDHHEVPPIAPVAYTIINPKQEGDSYPNKNICGAGVAFQLVRALIKSGKEEITPGWEKWLLDMVAIATMSDMVPLLGENRALAYYGLMVLRKSPRPGINALCERLKIDKKSTTEEDIGFSFGPRINAASRMGVPEDAFELLSTENIERARTLARDLDLLNNKRKSAVALTVKEIKKRLVKREVQGVIVVGDPLWKPSLLGLVANTLANEYGVPVFLWGREEGSVIKGSCRSPRTLKVGDIMEKAKESFIDRGGHDFSGGFSVSHERIHTLEGELQKAVRALAPVERAEAKQADLALELGDVSDTFLGSIERMRPFGEGNAKPLVCIQSALITSVSLFGKNEEHIRLSCTDGRGSKREAIAFFTRAHQFSFMPEEGSEVQIVGNIERSVFMGRSTLRLRIVDVLPLQK